MEEQDPSPEYIKGFNQMYKLKQEMPEVAQQILAAKGNSDRFMGMADGARQYQKDKIKLQQEKTKGRQQERKRKR